ncbi:hypothetical protein [Chromatium okenii]|uniref:Uncharacterized protein n=1 Tax=Chromatium okenii TaxID=61644 RepID=A0A2S7XRI1_9GAMM|nr:hypothetical protein [Chromatium okenii]PQJ96315.1 hypothetical protein CXB77_11275 [Chromatium okenii]
MQKSLVLFPVRIALLSAAAFTAFAWQPASAADSVCKGLAQADCEGNAQCRWQAALTRKDGVQVSAHCRKGTKRMRLLLMQLRQLLRQRMHQLRQPLQHQCAAALVAAAASDD